MVQFHMLEPYVKNNSMSNQETTFTALAAVTVKDVRMHLYHLTLYLWVGSSL